MDNKPQYIRDLPERITGQVFDIEINRGPTIATARISKTVGNYIADLWQIAGNPFPWRVRSPGKGIRRFLDEITAVEYFFEIINQVANTEK